MRHLTLLALIAAIVFASPAFGQHGHKANINETFNISNDADNATALHFSKISNPNKRMAKMVIRNSKKVYDRWDNSLRREIKTTITVTKQPRQKAIIQVTQTKKSFRHGRPMTRVSAFTIYRDLVELDKKNSTRQSGNEMMVGKYRIVGENVDMYSFSLEENIMSFKMLCSVSDLVLYSVDSTLRSPEYRGPKRLLARICEHVETVAEMSMEDFGIYPKRQRRRWR